MYENKCVVCKFFDIDIRGITGPANTTIADTQRTAVTTSVSTYSLPSGTTTYYYDTASGYTVASGNLVARPFTPSSGSFATVSQNTPVQIRSAPLQAQVHGKFYKVMVICFIRKVIKIKIMI